MFLLALIFIA
jgi:membrane-associated phospholipid phosphatase